MCALSGMSFARHSSISGSVEFVGKGRVAAVILQRESDQNTEWNVYIADAREFANLKSFRVGSFFPGQRKTTIRLK